MKKLLLPLLVFFVSYAFAQKIIKTEQVTNHSIHITGSTFDGVLFTANYHALYPVYDTLTYHKNNWYTPSNDDIISAEVTMYRYLKEKSKKSSKSREAFVFKSLNRSKRQFAGYINSTNEKFIYINGFPSDEEWAGEMSIEKGKTTKIPKWYNDIFEVMDGGPSFWQIIVDIKKRKIVFFGSNGVA